MGNFKYKDKPKYTEIECREKDKELLYEIASKMKKEGFYSGEDFEDWGHMVSQVDKGVLATALNECVNNLTPKQPSEVIIYQTPEDELE